MIKVALIGAGGIARAHHNAYMLLKESIQLCAVVDPDEASAQRIAARHDARVYVSLDAMFEAETPDYVDVCVPSYLHPEITIACLERKVHVLCEKPIAYELEQAKAMAACAVHNDRYLMIAQVIRFWPEYVWLKQACEQERYGKLKHISFSRFSQTPDWGSGWYTDSSKSGMAPFELHNHDTDYIHYLLGRPKAVSSIGLEEPHNQISLISTQYFYDGVVVHADSGWSRSSAPFLMSFRAVFEQAVVEFRDDRLMVYEQRQPGLEIKLEQESEARADINIQSAGGIYNEIVYFSRCIREGSAPSVVTPQDSIESLDMLLAELESIRTGTTIRLQELDLPEQSTNHSEKEGKSGCN